MFGLGQVDVGGVVRSVCVVLPTMTHAVRGLKAIVEEVEPRVRCCDHEEEWVEWVNWPEVGEQAAPAAAAAFGQSVVCACCAG